MSLTLSISPIWSRAVARLQKAGTITDFASERLEWAPSCRRHSPGILSLPNESLRATGTLAHTTIEAIRALEVEGEYLHGATIAYRLDGAMIADGCIYHRSRYAIGRPKERRRKFLLSRAEDYDEAQLSTDTASEMAFGHWIIDGLSTELLAINRGIQGITYSRKMYFHEPDYRKLVDIPASTAALAMIERLWVIDDLGINHDRAKRFLQLRERLRSNINVASFSSKKVFILRGSSGVSRRLINEPAIADEMYKRGFDILDPAKESSQQIVERLAGAKLVVSVEGSHQSHALLAMAHGGAFLTIQPPDRFVHHWKFIADLIDVKSAFVVADPSQQGFKLEIARLLRTIDLTVSAS